MFIASSSSRKNVSVSFAVLAATSAAVWCVSVNAANGESSSQYLRNSAEHHPQRQQRALQANLIPDEVLAVIPETCRTGDDSKLTVAINCAVGSLLQCSGLLGVMDQFENLIPDSSEDVTSCAAIVDPFCSIASECPPCVEKFEKLTRCIVSETETGVIDQSILDLIEDCTLTCDGSSGGSSGIAAGEGETVIDVGDVDNVVVVVVDDDDDDKDNDLEDIVMVVGDNEDEDNELDIPATAIEAGTFATLVAALGAANLVEALSGPNGPFTVFAPTDAAFDALPAGLVECLLNDIPTLTDILLYHVASGEVLASQLTDGMNITTLQGPTVVVDLSRRDSVRINGSTVTTPDVPTSNGVIHIINSVLVPPDVNIGAYLETCDASSEEPESESEYDNDNDIGVITPGGDSGGNVDDILGGIFPDGDVDVESIGDAIGDAVGSFLGEDVGNAIGGAVNSFISGIGDLFNNSGDGSGWFGDISGGNTGGGGGGWFDYRN